MSHDLPSGTVTFLFTDVEGSTRLLHELGANAYADVLADHRQVIREACAKEGGVEVDTQGDAFFFAFRTAPAAVAAASAFTDALASGPIQVRVGLHTGTPLLTNEGYVGDDVHRAARIAAAGHGGQVLASAATAQLVDVDLHDLGEHRFKDLAAAERVYQFGEESFPPLRTLHQTNLPVPATPFLGREKELGEVLLLLSRENSRLLTLTGPGGSGKTRLAAQAAGALGERYSHGVFWVPLAALRSPELVLESAAQILGARDGLARHIGDQQMLLLLDNFEHVVEAASGLASLLGACPHLEFLVTSREPLRLAGEQEYPVPPLVHEEAIIFFASRARAVKPDFEVDEAAHAICRRLDELPLALELAAARLTALSTKQIIARLEQRLPLLTGGRRDAPERQQTLAAAIEWSYDLLRPEEQNLFRNLSAFAGGCTLEAAEHVCDADLDVLQSLVEKNLLRYSNERYWMLETIREFAMGQCDAADADAVRRAHAEWFLRLAERAEEGFVSPEASTWLGRLDAELANVRAALEWSLTADSLLALRLASSLTEFWLSRGSSREALRFLDAAWSNDAPMDVRKRALRSFGVLAMAIDDMPKFVRTQEERLTLARATGDLSDAGATIMNLAGAAWDMGDLAKAENLCADALEIARDSGDSYIEALAISNLGVVARGQGDFHKSRSCLERGLTMFRAAGHELRVAWALRQVAETALLQRSFDEARESIREGFELAEGLGDVHDEYWLLWTTSFLEAKAGDCEDAVVLAGAVDAIAESRGFENLARYDGKLISHLEYMADLVCLRNQLGGEAYDQLFARGAALDLDEAIEFALHCLD
jgi:predicted ATPase